MPLTALWPLLLFAPPTTAATPPYLGHFEYRYPGMTLDVVVRDDATLKWTILGGDRAGQSAEQPVDRRLIVENIYLTSWTESDGTIVAQVADYGAMKLTSVLVFQGKRFVLEGTILRLPN